MVLSGGAPEFHPVDGSFTVNDHDFPCLGSVKKAKFHGPSWFREGSINPNLRRNITEMCEGFQEENRVQAAEIAGFKEKITALENRNIWLEGRNKRFKGRIEEQSSREIIHEENHTDYKERLMILGGQLVGAKNEILRKSRDIANILTELHDKEEKLRDHTVRFRKLLVTAEEMETSNEQWIGRTLKLRFIFDEVKKIGALPEDHAEWVMAMVESVTIPTISVRLRNQFLPSYEDAHMEDVDSEDESDLIEEWSREAAVFSDQLGEHISEQLGQNQSIMINHFVTIQRLYRGFMSRRRSQCLYGNNPVERVVSAIMIQKIYRGFRDRRVGSYSAPPALPRRDHPPFLSDSDSDDDMIGYGLRLQHAIQLSLSVDTTVFDADTQYNLTRIAHSPIGEMITDDSLDYDIAVMFN